MVRTFPLVFFSVVFLRRLDEFVLAAQTATPGATLTFD